MADLRGHLKPREMNTGSTGKIVAAIVVAIGLGSAAAYTVATGKLHATSPQRVASNELPSPAAPTPSTAAPQRLIVVPAPSGNAAVNNAVNNAAQNSPYANAPPPMKTARKPAQNDQQNTPQQ